MRISDWSSDVCYSDLPAPQPKPQHPKVSVMLQETTQAAAATGGNAASALTQMGVDHLLAEMMSDPGAYAVSWVVLITLLIMSAMSVYWIVINTFKNISLRDRKSTRLNSSH